MKSSNVKELTADFDNLYSAMLRRKRGGMNKESVLRFVLDAPASIYKLEQSINNDTYKLSPYGHFKVYEPKERDIVYTRFKDGVFQRCLCDRYFVKAMSRSFIYDNAACQSGKGNEFCRKRLVTHLQRYFRKHGSEGWVLQIDLKNYFGSTPHKTAIAAVEKRLDDEWVVSQIKRIIESYATEESPDSGLGLGCDPVQFIELAILDDVDHIIKEKLRIKEYVRYNDDFILIHESKAQLQTCRDVIIERLRELGLTAHPKKTQIFRLNQGIVFLGFRFRLSDTGKVIMTLPPEKIKDKRRKLRKLVKLAKEGKIPKSKVDAHYQSWRSYAGNKHKKGSVRKKARRSTRSALIEMDKYYKSLWEGDD